MHIGKIMWLSKFLWLSAMGLVLVQSSLWGEDKGWQAGVAKIKITPPQPMPMAGYASRGSQHATGTLNDLWAKALLIEDANGQRGLLVTMDLCGIDNQLSHDMCTSLADKLGLQRKQIVLSVSHTHSGPVVAKNLRPMHWQMFSAADQKLVDDYANWLVEQVTQCAVEAHENLQPSRVTYGNGVVTFATNRRNNPADDVPKRRAAGLLAGPVDHSLPVLAVYQQDQLKAAVFGYACHCTTLGEMEWSGDYAGFAQEEIEAQRPGCTAMFWAGCGADQNPLPRRTVELAQQYGRELADGVLDVLNGYLQPIAPSLSTQYEEIPLPFSELPSEQQLATDANSDNPYIASRARYLLTEIKAGKPLQPTYPYPVSCWKLGDSLKWIALGGEVVVDFSLAIKAAEALPGSTWVMGYAHDVMAYIPSRRVLTEGGYEGGGAMVYYGLPTTWAPELEALILQAVKRQTEQQ
jgi:neutral ceramidase